MIVFNKFRQFATFSYGVVRARRRGCVSKKVYYWGENEALHARNSHSSVAHSFLKHESNTAPPSRHLLLRTETWRVNESALVGLSPILPFSPPLGTASTESMLPASAYSGLPAHWLRAGAASRRALLQKSTPTHSSPMRTSHMHGLA